MELSPDELHEDTCIGPHERTTVLSMLAPDTTYAMKIKAIYDDGVEVTSGTCTFNTPGMQVHKCYT